MSFFMVASPRNTDKHPWGFYMDINHIGMGVNCGGEKGRIVTYKCSFHPSSIE